MTHRLRAFSIVLALAPLAAAQQYGIIETRHHYHFSDEPSGLRYRMTRIFRMPNNTETRSICLLEEGSGARMTLSDTSDYLAQTNVLEITDLETKDVARVTVRFPYKSATMKETIAEARAHPDLESIDLPTTIEVNGVSAHAKESEWLSERHARAARSSLRRAGSAAFLERLERLRPIAADRELMLFCIHLLRHVLYDAPCEEELQAQEAFGDCSFDASFGHPCSERQKQRIEKAVAAGEPSLY
jgi:hypothetical protein